MVVSINLRYTDYNADGVVVCSCCCGPTSGSEMHRGFEVMVISETFVRGAKQLCSLLRPVI